jgi:hypothetical protein
MIAVGLFVIIMVSGIGAVLAANTAHKKNQAQGAIIDNLGFIMEDMARNIRLGSNYVCPAGVSGNPPSDPLDDSAFTSNPLVNSLTAPADCPLGNEANSLVFEGQNGNPTVDEDQVGYVFIQNGPDDSFRLYKTTNNGEEFHPISPSEVELDPQSGFTVVGSALAPDVIQPRVIIRLSGKIKFKNVDSPFELQTTVSERLIDSQ